MFLFVVGVISLLLLIFFAVTQIIFPLWLGTPFFPLFRKDVASKSASGVYTWVEYDAEHRPVSLGPDNIESVWQVGIQELPKKS